MTTTAIHSKHAPRNTTEAIVAIKMWNGRHSWWKIMKCVLA